jgi:hypothetical protein
MLVVTLPYEHPGYDSHGIVGILISLSFFFDLSVSVPLLVLPLFPDSFLVIQKYWAHSYPQRLLMLHLFARPNAHPHNPLEFFRRIKPTTAVAKPMSCEIVREFVFAASCVGENMIGCERSPWFYLTAAEVASRISLGENIDLLLSGQ